MRPMSQPVFEKVAPVENFPEAEARVAAFWREREIFRRSLEQRAGGPRWTFYEGPPTANGLPHNGSVLTRVMKDVFPRYRSMRGYDVPRIAGWDTHGLPVEIEVEKELRISGKQAIVDYGVEPFVRRCIDSVFRYIDEWERLTEKLGFWVDLDRAYVTYHESYVESVWWALSQLFEQGLLYQGHKVVWWWAQGGTALSAAEVGEGYKPVDDPSLYVRMPLEDGTGRSLLAWTTTPWTLPSNSFAAVRPEFSYADVRDGDRVLVVAEALVPTLSEKVGRELAIERTYPGSELVGLRYTPPFDWFRADAPGGEGAYWRVVPADFVELDAGTGIVHAAPAFGEVDFELLQAERKQRDLPLLNAVRPDGSFDPERAPAEYAGRWVKECDRDLIRELRARELAWHDETYRHDYPFCWRAEDDPLIQYARPAWYVRTTDRVEEALANNAAVDWLPEHIQEGRFGDFLRNNVDWALSRERFWGTPLNIWINDETGAMEAPASVEAILERNPRAFERFEAAQAEDPSLSPHLRVHKPWIDYVTWQKPGEPGTWRRVPEVIDAWFDSGSMPFAQWGYPHRNREAFEQAFPADFICEAIDQTRGWFNSLLWISTLLFPDQPKPHPYRNCIVLGHVCDREGRKESKSKGNYTPPEIILDRLRLEFAVVDAGEGPPAGRARIGREDYEGMDFGGDHARVRVYRGDAEDAFVDLELEPAKLPRRVIELSPADRETLGVTPTERGRDTKLGEVPGLPASEKVFVEDPTTPAPGADAFRWFFFAANPPWNNTRHSLSGVRALQRDVPLKLRNVYAFFSIYANADGFDPSDAACRAGRRPAAERALLDRWILSELALTNQRVIDHMDGYRLYEATGELSAFVDALSNWYVRRSRDRFWAAGLEADKLDAHWTLYESVVTLARLLAPFLPFATEAIWQNLVRRPFADSAEDGHEESVHLADYPAPDAAAVDETLSEAMRLVREIVSLGMQVRTANKLKVRQPLEAAEVVLARPELAATIEPYLALVRDELNVQQIRFVPKADEYVTHRVTPNFRALGPRVGKRMPAVKRALGDADGAALLAELESNGHVRLEVDGETFDLSRDEIAVTLEAREGFAAAAGAAGVVVLRTTLTPELLDEGRFREVLNRVQTFRKELDLEYTGRIRLCLAGSETLLASVRTRTETLAQETLAVEVRLDAEPESGAEVREVTIDGEALRIGLTRA
ncbi:MAG: isoleucine--tRNA ligase [Myxococcales bacterium]|nr:isoleucine--tRNA ligase [Myxococcales bacterium]